MTFGNYIYQDNTSQSRQNAINQLINTADKLEAGHLKAVEAASQLQATIANLDMNEAEDGFKAGLQAELQQTIADNVQYGNMYYALDDIIKKSGDLLSRPDVIGRLRAQQDYKAFMDDLDKRTDIPEYLKNMYRDGTVNPYHYEDKVENGKIIGGSKWMPTHRPVSHIDEVKIIEQALKLVKPGTNNAYGSYYFVDANNNKIDPLKSQGNISDIALYDHTTGTRIELSPKDIKDALEALYDSDSAIRESVEQDMLYSGYRNSDYSTNTDLYYQEGERRGQQKTSKDYFIDKFGNATIAFAFKQTASDHNWQMFNSAALYGNGGAGVIPSAGDPSIESYDEGTVRTTYNGFSGAQQGLYQSTWNLGNLWYNVPTVQAKPVGQ